VAAQFDHVDVSLPPPHAVCDCVVSAGDPAAVSLLASVVPVDGTPGLGSNADSSASDEKPDNTPCADTFVAAAV
jgi:hypothetical protein